MILVVTQTFAPAKGGMESYLTGLADRLTLAGFDTTVLADAAAAPFAPEHPYALHRFGGWRPLRRWRKRRAVAALLAKHKIEGIFCDSWKSVESLPAKVRAPIAILAHGAEYPLTPSARKRRRIAACLKRTASIIANSRYTADAVRPFLDNPNDPRLIVINPPIAEQQEPSPQAQQDMLALIAARTPVLSTLARLEPRKGVDRVIAALPELAARFPSLVFLIGGGGADQPRLQNLAREKGVEKHVEFLGFVEADRKNALLKNSDVFAMPVRRVGTSVEGFGLSYIEAGWYGVPSLGGTNCGAADAVIDGETGLLVDGEDQAAVTAALLRLLENTEERRTFGANAQKRAQTQMLWDHILPRFIAALHANPGAPS